MTAQSGCLYIIATPIGNLDDISHRALNILSSVDLIAAEDTRHSGVLLKRYDIKTKQIAYHQHNEQQHSQLLIDRLTAGESIALITDAGTPLISDPGYIIVKSAHQANIPVIPIPGACAAIAALSASGLPTQQFTFLGYLPNKSKKRQTFLTSFIHESRTMIFYEAPHRIVNAIKDMVNLYGSQREATIAREISKQYEQLVTAQLGDLQQQLGDNIPIKGEFVIIISGAKELSTSDSEALRVYNILQEKLAPQEALSLTAKISNHSRNKLYQLVLEHKTPSSD